MVRLIESNVVMKNAVASKRGGRSCKYPKGFTSETASRTDHRALVLQYRVHSSARVKENARVIDPFSRVIT